MIHVQRPQVAFNGDKYTAPIDLKRTDRRAVTFRSVKVLRNPHIYIKACYNQCSRSPMTDSIIFRIEELNSSLRPRLKKQYYSSQLGLITYLRNIGWLEVNYGFLILIGLWTLPSLAGQKRKFTVWGQTRKVRIPMRWMMTVLYVSFSQF